MFQTDTMDNIDSIEWAEDNVTSLLVFTEQALNLNFWNVLKNNLSWTLCYPHLKGVQIKPTMNH